MPEPADHPGGPRRPRFGLNSLMLVTIIFCVMGAAGYHLLHAHGSKHTGLQATPALVFILLTVSAPMLLLIAISLGRQLTGWARRRSPRRRR